MARLPVPGQDGTNWGDLLNGFLRSTIINVQDKGADQTGATDATAAIQSAINDAATGSTVGGVVYFPPGTYLIGSALTLKSNVILTGNGYSTILKKKDGSGTFPVIGSGGQAISNAVIEKIRINGNKSTQTNSTSGQGGIELTTAGSLGNRVDNVYIENTVNNAIALSGSNNSVTTCTIKAIGLGTTSNNNSAIDMTGIGSLVADNSIYTTVGQGIKLNTGSHNSIVSDNRIYGAQARGIYVQGSNYVVVAGNALEACNLTGILVGDAAGASGGKCLGCSITGNMIKGTTGSPGNGILLYVGDRHTACSNNCTANAGTEVLLTNVTASTTIGNV